MMNNLKNYFSDEELSCNCGCGGIVSALLHDKMNALRHLYGAPLYVNSAFRCQNHNHKVGGSKNSTHMFGLACDITPNKNKIDLSDEQVGKLLIYAGICQFVGYGVYKNFVHLDIRTPKDNGQIYYWNRR